MSSFDRSGAPVVRWLNQYAMWAILGESAVIVVLAVTAMAVDRRQALKNKTALPGSDPGKAAVNHPSV
jgi:hypothetical protein